jgi:hypothetical protein
MLQKKCILYLQVQTLFCIGVLESGLSLCIFNSKVFRDILKKNILCILLSNTLYFLKYIFFKYKNLILRNNITFIMLTSYYSILKNVFFKTQLIYFIVPINLIFEQASIWLNIFGDYFIFNKLLNNKYKLFEDWKFIIFFFKTYFNIYFINDNFHIGRQLTKNIFVNTKIATLKTVSYIFLQSQFKFEAQKILFCCYCIINLFMWYLPFLDVFLGFNSLNLKIEINTRVLNFRQSRY